MGLFHLSHNEIKFSNYEKFGFVKNFEENGVKKVPCEAETSRVNKNVYFFMVETIYIYETIHTKNTFYKDTHKE